MTTTLRDFIITRNIYNQLAAKDQVLCIAPFDCELVDFRVRYKVASKSGIIYVVRSLNGETVANGGALLVAPTFIPVYGNANRNALTAVADGKIIAAGKAIGLKPRGDFVEIKELNITAHVRAATAVKDSGLPERVITHHVATAGHTTPQVAFITKFQCELLSVQARHRVKSTSGTMDVVRAASATAVASGTTLLSAAMDIAGANHTNIDGSILAAPDNVIPLGYAIGLTFGGDTTSLEDLDVTFHLRRKL